MKQVPEKCDWCGKLAVPKWENIVKAFCSDDCMEKYLASEGFAREMDTHCPKNPEPVAKLKMK